MAPSFLLGLADIVRKRLGVLRDFTPNGTQGGSYLTSKLELNRKREGGSPESLISQQSKLFSGLRIYQLWDLAKFHLHFVYFSTWHRLTGFGFPSLTRNDLFQTPNWPLLAKLTVSGPTFFVCSYFQHLKTCEL